MSGDGGDRGFSAENCRSGPETGYIEVGTFCSVLIELFSKAVWYLRVPEPPEKRSFRGGIAPRGVDGVDYYLLVRVLGVC